MNKNELIKCVSEEAGLTQKESRQALLAIANLIKESLKQGKDVKIAGLGKFSVRNRASRVTTNPQTKQPMQIPATKVTTFKASKELKTAVAD